MNLLSWIVIGMACGWLVGALLLDDDPWILLDIVFATVGAVIAGGWVVPDERAFRPALEAFDQGGAAAAAAGALLLSLALRWIGRHIDAQARRGDTARAADRPERPGNELRSE